jgi:hypothetical protein
MQRLTDLAAALGALITLGFLLDAAELGEPERLPVLAAFGAWAISPFVGVAIVMRRVASERRAALVMTVAAIALSGVSAWLLYQTFVVHLDPQSAIAFVVLPLYQIGALLLPVLAAFYLHGRPSA